MNITKKEVQNYELYYEYETKLYQQQFSARVRLPSGGSLLTSKFLLKVKPKQSTNSTKEISTWNIQTRIRSERKLIY